MHNIKIDYEYTKFDRLDTPHKYMYTTYLGVDFINRYFDDRVENLRRFKLIDSDSCDDELYLHLSSESKNFLENSPNKEIILSNESLFNRLLLYQPSCSSVSNIPTNLNRNRKKLSIFSIKSEVNTKDLLISLIFSQLNKDNPTLTKKWIDRLVQRFEVTKKLYEQYPFRFRKGSGSAKVIDLYWLMSLSLMLYYAETGGIKYLSTMLKVSDLLCSLDEDFLLKTPLFGLSLVLSAEVLFIKHLSRGIKGVEFVFE